MTPRFLLNALVALFCGGPATATISPATELYRFAPTDAGFTDRFSVGVSMNNGLAAFGSFADRAWLYDISNPGAPAYLTTLANSNSYDFGDAVAIGNGVVALHSEVSTNRGQIEFVDPSLTPPSIVSAAVPGGVVGPTNAVRLAFDGDTLISSMYLDTGKMGAALFDVSDPYNPTPMGTLVPSVPGFANVAIDGNIALVTGNRPINSNRSYGRVYIFDISDPFAPQELAVIESPRPGVIPTFGPDGFGSSVAIDGDLIAIGQNKADSVVDEGRAWLFDISDPSSPQLLSYVREENRTNSFGQRLDLDNGLLAVGANGIDNFAGAVFMYDVRNPQAPVFLDKVTGSQTEAGDQFGLWLDLSDGLLLVAAPEADANMPRSGEAYLFQVVPEPTSAVLLTAGALLIVRRRRHVPVVDVLHSSPENSMGEGY